MSLYWTSASAKYDLAECLPPGATILQVLTHAAFDTDASNELLVLVEEYGYWSVFLIDVSSNGYQILFQTSLGPADYLRKERVGEMLAPLAIGDINGDGLMDFWVGFFSPEYYRSELRIYISSNGTYRNVAEVSADYDIQFVNYEGEWVIHSIDKEYDLESLRLHSFVWIRELEQFVPENEGFQLSMDEYSYFSHYRLRPQLFSGRNPEGKLRLRWCRTLLTGRETPHGRSALTKLLPEKAYLLDYIADQALDDDVDTEYLLAYLMPDSEDERKVRLHAAVADWSSEEKRYNLIPLEESFYGLARSAEGNVYQPIYLLNCNGLSHPVIVGNAQPDKPLIHAMIFANEDTEYKLIDAFQANYSLQLKERASSEGIYLQAILGNLGKDGRIHIEVKQSNSIDIEGICQPFSLEKSMVMTVREFRRAYPFFEKTEWISGGYDAPILKTNHREIPAFMGLLPDSQNYRTKPEEYLSRFATGLKLRSFWVEDFNNDGILEAVVLIRTEASAWPPYYRAGYLRPYGDQLEIVPLGPPFQPGDEKPESGVYLVDIDGDRQREIIMIRRGTNPETLRRGINLEVLGFINNQWMRMHAREIWYDDLRLHGNPGNLRLSGFLAQSARRTHGTVYSFLWQNEGFRLEKKIPVNSFESYLRNEESAKEDFLITHDVIRMW